MNIFNVIPTDLFSILASPNRAIYSDALMVLYDAFHENFNIPRDTLFTMIRSRLESDLVLSDFEEEGIFEEEAQDLSGKARFLIRKLKEKGWIEIERDGNFSEDIIIPEYSIRIIEILKSIAEGEKTSGFSYVFDTFSSLKLANEDENAGVYEKTMTLSSAREKTEAMTNALKRVNHNINGYVQQLINSDNINEILATHFDDFYHKIIEEHIQPLKIKDSIPKYKNPINNILDSWLSNDDIINGMALANSSSSRVDNIEDLRHEIISKIFFIKESYEKIETEYLGEIDDKVRKYTRATTKKIEYLTNNDKTVRGNLIYLLNKITKSDDDDVINEIGKTFHLYKQTYLSESSLYKSRKAKRKAKHEPVLIDETDGGITEKLIDEFASYHKQVSKLRITTKIANLKQKKKYD